MAVFNPLALGRINSAPREEGHREIIACESGDSPVGIMKSKSPDLFILFLIFKFENIPSMIDSCGKRKGQAEA
jgi:hypothetical protein